MTHHYLIIIKFYIAIHMLILNASKGLEHSLEDDLGTVHRHRHAYLTAHFLLRPHKLVIVWECLEAGTLAVASSMARSIAGSAAAILWNSTTETPASCASDLNTPPDEWTTYPKRLWS